MHTSSKWVGFSLIALLVCATLACVGQAPTASPTETPAPPGGPAGQNANLIPTNPPTATRTSTPSATPTPTPTPTQVTATPSLTASPTTPVFGPYVVKQIRSVGHETISGSVCSIVRPFTVSSQTPQVAFVMNFVPAAEDHGNWTYAYSISSAGESHDAKGTYTLKQASANGTLLLTMAGSDHVAFHGFDGNIPFHYDFNLAPATGLPCPPQP